MYGMLSPLNASGNLFTPVFADSISWVENLPPFSGIYLYKCSMGGQ